MLLKTLVEFLSYFSYDLLQKCNLINSFDSTGYALSWIKILPKVLSFQTLQSMKTQKFLFDLTLSKLHVAIHIGSICLSILSGSSIFQLESILVISEVPSLVILLLLQLLLLSNILLYILVSFLEVKQNHLRGLLE